jgi:hypothetical protein
VCSGQLISDTTIGFFSAMFRSKTPGDRLPRTEFIREFLHDKACTVIKAIAPCGLIIAA